MRCLKIMLVKNNRLHTSSFPDCSNAMSGVFVIVTANFKMQLVHISQPGTACGLKLGGDVSQGGPGESVHLYMEVAGLSQIFCFRLTLFGLSQWVRHE